MPSIPQTRILYQTQRRFEERFGGLMEQALDAAVRRLNAAAGADGIVPPSAALGLTRGIQDDVSRVLVGVGAAPVSPEGVGLSPFARELVAAVQEVEDGIAEAHSAFIRTTAPPPVGAWLLRSTYSGLPPVPYDPLHLWVDPAGYRLSDRIWKTAISARQKLDKYLAYNIQAGTSALRMARELESMLLPGRSVIRTARPYGIDVSFDAMRLARTEIARAHSALTKAMSVANPFVTGLDWALSARHPKVDICDSLATIGMSGERKREPYPVESAPVVVQDSHVSCICNNRPYVSDTSTKIKTLSERMDVGETPPVTPIDSQRFLSWVKTKTASP